MESLTPFIRHELEDAPGPSGPPEETSSVVSPPLGVEPGQPPVTEPPKPGCGSQQPGFGGSVTGGGLFGAEQHLHSREPAPDEDQSGVLQLVEWREEAPYG